MIVGARSIWVSDVILTMHAAQDNKKDGSLHKVWTDVGNPHERATQTGVRQLAPRPEKTAGTVFTRI